MVTFLGRLGFPKLMSTAGAFPFFLAGMARIDCMSARGITNIRSCK